MKLTKKSQPGPGEQVRRSDLTRERILAAARDLFATLGYDRTTVRMIADKAKIHASLVIRYFGSKEHLFAESSSFDLQLPDLSSTAPERRGEALVRHFLDRWENKEPGDLPALLRLSVTHPDGREKLIAVFRKQVEPAIKRIAGSRDPAVSAALIATQIVGIAFLRYVVRLPGIANLDRNELLRRAGKTVQSYLEDRR